MKSSAAYIRDTSLAVIALLLIMLVMVRISMPVYHAVKGYAKEVANTESESDEKDGYEKDATAKVEFEKEKFLPQSPFAFCFALVTALFAQQYGAYRMHYVSGYHATIHLPPPDLSARTIH